MIQIMHTPEAPATHTSESEKEKINTLFAGIDAHFFQAENLSTATPNNFSGYSTVEHRFQAPLDYNGQYLDGFQLDSTAKAQLPATITIFAREYIAEGGADLPRLIYFQGGPGSAGTRPTPMSGWMQLMLKHYRIVMLDERGTGLSHAMDVVRLNGISDPVAQAAYLACFRADYIVADAELLRHLLQDNEKWSAFGQSFGGFCITSYLSLAPNGLEAAFITAGLPSTYRHADDVYQYTWESLEQRNAEYFRQFPADEETCWQIVEHLASQEEFLPTGERLTPRRFRMLGMALGRSYGFEKLHYLLEDPFIELPVSVSTTNKISPTVTGTTDANGVTRRLSTRFLTAVGAELSFAGTPLYWTLHEAIYAQNTVSCNSGLGHDGATSSAWAAQRVRNSLPQFRIPALSAGAAGEIELRKWAQEHGFGFRFSCEHVFPWQGEEDPALRSLAAATELLANFENFPPLHYPEVLAKNSVPVKAWIYQQDMFVPFKLSMETAKQIRGLEPLISDTFHHDALHMHTDEIIAGFLGDSFK